MVIELTESRGREKVFAQKLKPNESFYFVWPELKSSSRELYWSAEKNIVSYPLKLTKSGKDKETFDVEYTTPSRDAYSDTEGIKRESLNFQIWVFFCCAQFIVKSIRY